jgi:hypothetical protein
MTYETTADNEWAAPASHRMSRRTAAESGIVPVVQVRRCAS